VVLGPAVEEQNRLACAGLGVVDAEPAGVGEAVDGAFDRGRFGWFRSAGHDFESMEGRICHSAALRGHRSAPRFARWPRSA
jgi:hypothetical protein